MCVTIAERSGYSFCFSNRTDQGDESRDGGFGGVGINDGEIRGGEIEEGGWDATFHCLILYLAKVLCLSVCVSQFVSERSAILLVLGIKLTKETRRRDSRGKY